MHVDEDEDEDEDEEEEFVSWRTDWNVGKWMVDVSKEASVLPAKKSTEAAVKEEKEVRVVDTSKTRKLRE